jgi:thioredoxin 1
VVEQVALEQGEKVKVVTLDAQQNYATASAYGIMGLPTLLFFKGGAEVARVVGAVPKRKIDEVIQQNYGG